MKLYFLKKITPRVMCVLLFINFLKITFFPEWNLIYWCSAVITLDLITGIIKSLVAGKFVISEGLKRTVSKLAQYIGVVLLLFIFTNAFTYDPEATKRALAFFGTDNMYKSLEHTITYVNNFTLLLIIYTESLSISENLVAIDPNSIFSKYILRPLHYLMSFGMFNNPLVRMREAFKGKNNNTKPH